jgi:hypothetical protein
MKRDVSKTSDADVLEDNLLIPSIPPSFLNGCNIIDISYILEVRKHLIRTVWESHNDINYNTNININEIIDMFFFNLFGVKISMRERTKLKS